jgi:transposase
VWGRQLEGPATGQTSEEVQVGQTIRLGIDVACRADHQASCANGVGEFLWSGWRFRTIPRDLERLWAKLPEGADVTVVLEPTRNAWVPLAAWLQARGAKVVMVPPEQSADLRDYYNKHTKTDRLDSRVLARLPLLHPDGLRPIDHLGPAQPLLRAVRSRSRLVKRRTAVSLRLDTLLELLGPSWADVLGTGDYSKSALAVLERYADPRALEKLGRKRLTTLLVRASRGAWRESKADDLLLCADESIELWAGGGLDFEELAADIATDVRLIRQLNAEIAAMDDRIEALYDEADPKGIFVSTPGIGVTLSAGILGRLGDPDRFANLAGVRSFTGLVPKIDQSGLENRRKGVTKAGDPGLREALYLAADLARKVDPTLAARYHRLVVDEGRHHVSAVCTLAAVLATRIAACWRRGETYVLHDSEGNEITEDEGRTICAERYKVSAAVRQARRNGTQAKKLKQAGRGSKESTKAAPASSPPVVDATRAAAVA